MRVELDSGVLAYIENGDVYAVPLDHLESATPRKIIDVEQDVGWFLFFPDEDRMVTIPGRGTGGRR